MTMDERRLAAIVFTDIVGYTSMMADDEQAALNAVAQQREVLGPIIESHSGQWLKEMGDGTLSSFPSATNAVQCAIDIQKQLKDYPNFKIRIGVHLGDVVFTQTDVFGDGVNIAARIEPNAMPGGIAISGSVYDTLSNNKHFKTVFLGEKTLKNVGRPLRIYAISNDELPVGEPFANDAPPIKARTTRATFNPDSIKRNAIIAASAALVILLIVGFQFIPTVDTLPTDDLLTQREVAPVLTQQQEAPPTNDALPTNDPSEDLILAAQEINETAQPQTDTTTTEAELSANDDRAQVVSSEPVFVSPVQPGLIVATDSVPVEVSSPEDELPAVVLESPSVTTLSSGNTSPSLPAGPDRSSSRDKSIAVLPLTNLSADPENAYFAAGVHEEILGQLAKISELRVISRRSVLQYEDTTENIASIADALNVATIMEGSVRFSGNRVRITCQLINVSNDTPIWSQTYERELEDIFSIQADVALQAAAAMQASLLPSELNRIEQAATQSTEAYTLYLQSNYRAEQQSYSVTTSPDGWIQQGIKDLERAVELDSGFAQAYAQLAYVQSFSGFSRIFEGNNSQAEQAAIINANRAIELDPYLSKAYSVLAISAVVNRRWSDFLDYADKILALPDIETTTYSDLAIGYAVMQRYERSVELIESAVLSDPNSAAMRWLSIVVALVSRDYENVLVITEQYAALGGDTNSYHLYRAAALEFLGRDDEAALALSQISGDLSNQDFGFYPFYSYLNCKSGNQTAMQLFAAQQTIFNLTLSNIGCRLALGDLDGIYDIVRALMITGVAFPDLGEVFDKLKEDDRYSEIENYMSLPEEAF